MVSALVIEVRTGNQKVVSAFYEETWNELFGHFKKRGIEIEDAEDIFQEAFLAFINVIKTKNKLDSCCRKECKKFLTGIVKIKINEFFRLKTKGLEQLYELKEAYRFLQMEYDDTKEQKIGLVEEKLDEIDDTCKRILRMYYFEKLSPEEILKRIKHINSTGSLKVTKSRCLKKLRKLIDENGSQKQGGMD